MSWLDGLLHLEGTPGPAGPPGPDGPLTGNVTGTRTATVVEKIGGLAGVATVLCATLQWPNNVAGTVTGQDNTTNGATAIALTIRGSNATGTASTGAALNLGSGSGTSTHGKVNLQIAGVTKVSLNGSALEFEPANNFTIKFASAASGVTGHDITIAAQDTSAGNIGGAIHLRYGRGFDGNGINFWEGNGGGDGVQFKMFTMFGEGGTTPQWRFWPGSTTAYFLNAPEITQFHMLCADQFLDSSLRRDSRYWQTAIGVGTPHHQTNWYLGTRFSTDGSNPNERLEVGGNVLIDGNYLFRDNVATPTLKQSNVTTAAATGKPMLVQAQNSTGTGATVGGSATLVSGTGDTGGELILQAAAGSTAIKAGLLTFKSGSDIVGQFSSGSTSKVLTLFSTAGLQTFQVKTDYHLQLMSGQVGSGTIQFLQNATLLAVMQSDGDGISINVGTNPSTVGAVRLPNNRNISARNAANNGNVDMWKVNASDWLETGAKLMQWASAVIGPSLAQISTSSGPGQPMTVEAQTSTQTNGAGGKLVLRGGAKDGTGLKGGVELALDASTSDVLFQLKEVAAGRRVVGLATTAGLAGADVPSGDLVLYVADALTIPTNGNGPPAGFDLYSRSQQPEVFTRYSVQYALAPRGEASMIGSIHRRDMKSNTVQTTNVTATTILTIDISAYGDNLAFSIFVRVNYFQTGGSSYHGTIEGTCSGDRRSGTNTVTGVQPGNSGTNGLVTGSTPAGSLISSTVSGANILIQVTAGASATIDWYAVAEVDVFKNT